MTGALPGTIQQESDIMNLLAKEWKNICFVICMIAIIVYLSSVNSQLKSLQTQNSNIISTFDSIESVAISTDADIHEMTKKVDKIENNVSYIVKKVRRR
jgi:hypothetical protein